MLNPNETMHDANSGAAMRPNVGSIEPFAA